jgi:hypothetical protein
LNIRHLLYYSPIVKLSVPSSLSSPDTTR